jgi:hypothetical protein
MMTTIFQLPLQNTAQNFTITLSGIIYTFTLQYRNIDQGGWILDIGDVNNIPILQGIPLITGANLLNKYRYLGFLGGLYVQTTTNPDAIPTFTNIGIDGQLYYVTA